MEEGRNQFHNSLSSQNKIVLIYVYCYCSRRMRSDSVQSDLLLGANTTILSSKPESRNGLLTEKHHHHHLHHHRHHCHRCSDEIIRCPHHVALPDGEWSHSYSNLQSVSVQLG